MNERHLIGILVVERDCRCFTIEPQISVEAGGQLGEVGRSIEIELALQETIGGRAEPGEQRGERNRAEQNSRV